MMNKIAVIVVGCAVLFSVAPLSHAAKLLSGDEIKSLVTGKTTYVTTPNGRKFRQVFNADGSSERDNGQKSEWHVDGDKHCNTAAVNAPCANIRDNGDGTYTRILEGNIVADWTKIVDGKDF